MDRGTGACCRAFPLNTHDRFYTHADVELIRRAVPDGGIVADMIVPIESVSAAGHALWTCRHFDGRDCVIYETRPTMCVEHGTNVAPCSNDECELPQSFVPIGALLQRTA